MKKVKTLFLLAVLGSAAFADKASFVRLCEDPRQSDATKLTIQSLRKFALKFDLNRDKLTCQGLADKLETASEIAMPDHTFFYYKTPDLTPIAHLDWIKSLDISNQEVQSLDPLKYLKLETLDIQGVKASLEPVRDLTTVRNLKITLGSDADVLLLSELRLQELEIFVKAGVSLRGLPNAYQKLTLWAGGEVTMPDNLYTNHLEIHGLKAKDTKWMAQHASSIQELTFSNVEIGNLKSFPKLWSARKVTIVDSKIQDVSFLAQSIVIRELDLSRNEIRDTAPLAALRNLEKLVLDQNPIYDARELNQLFKLETLSIREAKLPGAFHLGYLERLRVLDLTGNHFHTLPIADLSDGNYRLQELYLTRNGARWVDPTFKYLRNLKVLGLAENKLTTVTDIAELENLETLYVQDNKLTDLSPLSKLKKLKKLWFTDNPLPQGTVCPVQPASICNS